MEDHMFEHGEISKRILTLQKQAFFNTLDSIKLCREQAERVNNFWMDTLNLPPGIYNIVDQWRSEARQVGEDLKKVISTNYNNWETHFSRFGAHSSNKDIA
jgi:hypothetical protein